MTKLPDKPSELLKVAMTDLELCENDDRYEIDMLRWQLPLEDTCYVCMAGSVLAKSIKVPIDTSFGPKEMPSVLENQLYAINSFRIGEWRLAFFDLGMSNKFLELFPREQGPPYTFDEVCSFSDMFQVNREEWKTYMCDAIGILEAEGL